MQRKSEKLGQIKAQQFGLYCVIVSFVALVTLWVYQPEPKKLALILLGIFILVGGIATLRTRALICFLPVSLWCVASFLLLNSPAFEPPEKIFFMGLLSSVSAVVPALLYSRSISIRQHFDAKYSGKMTFNIIEGTRGPVGYSTEAIPQSRFFYLIVSFFCGLMVLLFGTVLYLMVKEKAFSFYALPVAGLFLGACYGFIRYLVRVVRPY